MNSIYTPTPLDIYKILRASRNADHGRDTVSRTGSIYYRGYAIFIDTFRQPHTINYMVQIFAEQGLGEYSSLYSFNPGRAEELNPDIGFGNTERRPEQAHITIFDHEVAQEHNFEMALIALFVLIDEQLKEVS
jgi:hypothetical protein